VKSRNALMDAAYDDEEYVDDRTDSLGQRTLSSIWSRRFTALAIVSKKYERRLAGSPLVAVPLAVVDPSPVRRLGREGTRDGVVYKLPMLASPGCTSCSNRGLRT
jgi:hypothetical protein